MNSSTKFWDKSAKLYDFLIKKDAQAYEQCFAEMQKSLKPQFEILELATGTGLFALALASSVKHIEATDFSEKMIAQAQSKDHPANVHFSKADACALPFTNSSFDVVVIANALHIMPAPEKAL